MSPVDTTAGSFSGVRETESVQPPSRGPGGRHTPAATIIETAPSPLSGVDILKPDSERARERFIPVTRFALMERLTVPEAWPAKEAGVARRFFSYLDYWRHQRYGMKLLELEQVYEPFSPDSDLLMTREFTDDELDHMQTRVISQMRDVLQQANYEEIDPSVITQIMTAETHYGLDLHVDFSLFEECMVFYRGASTRKDQRRQWRKFMRKEEFDVPIFQRLFLLFKLKTLEQCTRDFMQKEKVSYKEALRMAKKQRAHLPAAVTVGNIYMKLFKNIPRSDVEMIFPNTVVKYRMFDKIKLGGGGAVGIGSSVAVAAGKIGAAVANPVVAVMVVGGLGAAVFRQAMNFVNTKQRYMVVMAQNLYFHSMADNRGVMIKLIDRAAEEDVKEEILLYSVLAKERAHKSDLRAIDLAIEQYLCKTFGIEVDFDLDDALSRLIEDGIVTENPDGTLTTLPPKQAAEHLDAKWDVFLDNLPDIKEHVGEGEELEASPEVPAAIVASAKKQQEAAAAGGNSRHPQSQDAK